MNLPLDDRQLIADLQRHLVPYKPKCFDAFVRADGNDGVVLQKRLLPALQHTRERAQALAVQVRGRRACQRLASPAKSGA